MLWFSDWVFRGRGERGVEDDTSIFGEEFYLGGIVFERGSRWFCEFGVSGVR